MTDIFLLFYSNMKFAMNGGLIIGTLDGANIEIMQVNSTEEAFCKSTFEHLNLRC